MIPPLPVWVAKIYGLSMTTATSISIEVMSRAYAIMYYSGIEPLKIKYLDGYWFVYHVCTS